MSHRASEAKAGSAADAVEDPHFDFIVSKVHGLNDLWAETTGDPRICIAVLDGPVELSHPSLVGANITQLGTFLTGCGTGGTASQHGTHVASVIFGQHKSLLKGVAPGCRGLILPVFNDSANGAILPCSQVNLSIAVSLAVQLGANIINISGGQFSPSGTAHPILANVIKECDDNNILIISSAGNQGCECLHVPGALPSVLAVGAMDSKGEPSDFSNWGPIYESQGVLAPGIDILGAVPGGRYKRASGTSFATPIVSGVAGLLLSLQLKKGRRPNVGMVRQAILRTAFGCDYKLTNDCRRLLAGRLNVRGSASFVLQKGESEGRGRLTSNSGPISFHDIHETSWSDLQMSGLLPQESRADCADGIGSGEGATGSVAPSSHEHPRVLSSEGQDFETVPEQDVSRLPYEESTPSEVPGRRYSASNDTQPRLGDARRQFWDERGSIHASSTGSMQPQSRPIVESCESTPTKSPTKGVVPAECGCGCKESGGVQPLVYVLGEIFYDFESEARFDSIRVLMSKFGELLNPRVPSQLRDFLDMKDQGGTRTVNSHVAAKVQWLVRQSSVSIYVFKPPAEFTELGYDLIREFFREFIDKSAPIIAIGGRIIGQARISNGQILPLVEADIDAMFNFQRSHLIEAAIGKAPTQAGQPPAANASDEQKKRYQEEKAAFDKFVGLSSGIDNFLKRIIFEARNPGITPQQRAVNFSATNVLGSIARNVDLFHQGYIFDQIEVARSPVCRPDSECYDIKVYFFPPDLTKPRRVVQTTVDVSDVVPVTLAEEVEWFAR